MEKASAAHRICAVWLVCALTACQGFGTLFRVLPSARDSVVGAEDRQKSIGLARGFAERHRWPLILMGKEAEELGPVQGRILLAEWGHLMDSVPVPGGFAKMTLSVSVAEDGSALYFGILDLSNSSETDYVRGVREELLSELESTFGENAVEVDYRGPAGSRVVAP